MSRVLSHHVELEDLQNGSERRRGVLRRRMGNLGGELSSCSPWHDPAADKATCRSRAR